MTPSRLRLVSTILAASALGAVCARGQDDARVEPSVLEEPGVAPTADEAAERAEVDRACRGDVSIAIHLETATPRVRVTDAEGDCSLRWLARAGARAQVAVWCGRAQFARVETTQTKRATQLEQDLQTLLKLVLRIAGVAETTREPCATAEVTLEHDHATLDIAVDDSPVPAELAADLGSLGCEEPELATKATAVFACYARRSEAMLAVARGEAEAEALDELRCAPASSPEARCAGAQARLESVLRRNDQLALACPSDAGSDEEPVLSEAVALRCRSLARRRADAVRLTTRLDLQGPIETCQLLLGRPDEETRRHCGEVAARDLELVSGEGEAPAPPPDAALRRTTVRMITGPREYLSLSANAVVNEVSQLEFDSDAGELVLDESPPRVLVGVDFSLSDLAVEKRQRLGVKLMVEASSHPGDALGVALTYRGPFLWMRYVAPFVGVLQTRQDELEDGELVRGGDRQWDPVVGLSFNLTKALDWVGPKS